MGAVGRLLPHFALSAGTPSRRGVVKLILTARGVVVSYESIREWGLRFGRMFAKALKRRRPRPGDKWFKDEVFIHIRGKRQGTSSYAGKWVTAE